MMKLTKADLKEIVKECLAEILSEGLGAAATVSKAKRPTALPVRPESLNARRPSSHLHEAVRREAGGNKVMEMILADTAASTLPKMLEGDRRGSHVPSAGGVAEQVVASVDPGDLFGEEAASKWASLAFMDSSSKK